jgi:guanylate kinase
MNRVRYLTHLLVILGKGTIINRFMEAQKSDQSLSGIPQFVFSVSHTTRQPREGEVNGVHYHFTTVDQMQKEIDDGKFIEHAEVHGNLYGSSFKSIVVGSNQQCLLDIDVEGVRSIKEYQSRQQADDNTMPILDPKFIFIAPPSIEVLKERLKGRGTETKETLERRFNNATAELEYGMRDKNFDTIVVNDDLEQACEDFELAVREMYEGTVHV